MNLKIQPPFNRFGAVLGRAVYISVVLMAFWMFFNTYQGDSMPSKDTDVYCRAGGVIRSAQNPYLVSALGSEVSWNYLPIYAYGFRFLCNRMGFLANYTIFYILIFLASLESWLGNKNWLYGLALCATGLYSFGWTLKTGNFSIGEFFLFSLSALMLLKKQYRLACFLLGLTASMKIFPALYFPVFLILIPGKKQKITSLLWGLAGFALPFILSTLLHPELMPWFFKQLLGLIPGQHSAIGEKGSIYNPSFAFMILSLFRIQLAGSTELLISFGILLLLAPLAFLLIRKTLPGLVQERPELALGLGIITITLLMPRIKPYGFLPALLAIYLITRNQDDWQRAGFLLILSIIPLGIKAFIQQGIDLPMTGFAEAGLFFLEHSHQPFFLLVSFFGILWITMKQGKNILHNSGELHVQD